MPPRMSILRGFPFVDYWDCWLPPRVTKTKLGVIPLEISVQQYVVKYTSVRPQVILNLFGKSLIFRYQGVLCHKPYSSPVRCSEPQKGKSAAFGYWIVQVSCMCWCSALTDVHRAGVVYVRDLLSCATLLSFPEASIMFGVVKSAIEWLLHHVLNLDEDSRHKILFREEAMPCLQPTNGMRK